MLKLDDNLLPDEKPVVMTPEAEDDLLSGYIPEQDETPLRVAPPDRRLVTQPFDFVVRTIVNQVEDKSLIVRPPYQRGYVWDDGRASRLIESLLMNIPIPACYFAEEDAGVFTVIDGQQRLYSIWRFVRNHFGLRSLRTLTEYNGKEFKDLTERDQRLILGRTIRCIVITQESHPEIRFEVFERLNTGSVQLTDQEIRNAIYRGDFNDLIKSLAEQPRWLGVLNKAAPDKRMRDDELVVRFFAVHDDYVNYLAPLRTFLNLYTARKGARLTEAETRRLTLLFETTVDKVSAVFGDHAFRSFNSLAEDWERQINRALFDAVMLVFSRLPVESLVSKRDEIELSLKALFDDSRFLQSIGRSTADRASFFERIRLFSEAMERIGLRAGLFDSLQQA
ncbi:MAG: DUF262 domain-containing protein [Candidatus Hydrogenedentes bacterium]|nr:DUF262 domain-containing protein [Candidatus Hydrogenedentota bacterium]